MAKADPETARELARLSTDSSFLLTHLIRQNCDRTDEEARAILGKILGLQVDKGEMVLKANNAGWYGVATANIYNPILNCFDRHSFSKAVCFTESTLSGLRAHREVFFTKYGIAFDRDWLFGKGANPCLNIRGDLFGKEILREGERYERHIYNFIPAELHPFVNIISEGFDATHEREWRYAGDLIFTQKDILFIFCPEKDFPIFSKIQENGKPVLFDLKWLDRI